jgi:geranylgeranyl diphosphate synthase type II
MGIDLKEYLSEKSCLVDSYLREYFRKANIKPPLLKGAMVYSLSAGGKRLRPILALAAYEACGKKDAAKILRYASALELIHTYSLIHDDLPAMDDDDLRRGKPTNHKVFGEAMAILAGDGLLTEAFRMLSVPENGIKPNVLLNVIEDVGGRAGLRGMVAGQAQDILAESGTAIPSLEGMKGWVKFIHLHKTAQLITASVRMGGLLAGANEEKMLALTQYGRSIGLAFQIKDDILDVKGETALMGKAAGSDERKGKLTYPAVMGLARSEREAQRLVQNGLKAVKILGRRGLPLQAIAIYILERRQ